MDQDEPGRNSPQSGGQRPVSTVRSYSRLRSYTGHGKLTCLYLVSFRDIAAYWSKIAGAPVGVKPSDLYARTLGVEKLE